MSGRRHARKDIEAFLDADFRQVWAADRATGNPRFLPDGQAKALRATAKAEWRCPVPECTVEITTVGGSRRHHFRHNQPAPHASDGESESHLAAKAMIVDWARRKMPTGASAREEHTVKDPKTSRYRRADAMVTWPDTRLTAFEVEYKQYDPDQWALKQSDYDHHVFGPIACVWLLGHLRIKRPPKNSHKAEDPQCVRIPELCKRWRAAGQPLLVVNPTTREVATIVSDRPDEHGDRHPAATDDYGTLCVDPLDECELHPVHGLITPTLRRIELADEHRRVAEEKRRQQEQKRLEEAHRLQAERERRQRHYEDLRTKQRETWEASPLAAVFARRWHTIPTLLELAPQDNPDQSGVWAHPAHWRGVIYEELIHPFALGRQPTLDEVAETAAILPPRPTPRFAPNDILDAFAAHGIEMHRNRQKSFNTVLNFLERLQRWHVLAIHRDPHDHRRVRWCEATGYPLDKAQADYDNHLAAQRDLLEQQIAAKEARKHAQRERVFGTAAPPDTSRRRWTPNEKPASVSAPGATDP